MADDGGLNPNRYHLLGFRVETVKDEENGGVGLFLVGRSERPEGVRHEGGVILASTVCEADGEARRAHMLLAAIARFLNAGGSKTMLSRMVESISGSLDADHIHPQGFEFLDVDRDESAFITCWGRDGEGEDPGEGLIVHEDLFSERVPLEKMHNYLSQLVRYRDDPFDTSPI